MDWVINPEIWASLLTLTALEIVLGIDNLVFIAILAGRLPAGQQNRARQVGLALALISRLALLASIRGREAPHAPQVSRVKPAIDEISQRADHALAFQLPLVARTGWKSEQRGSPVAINDYAQFDA